MKMLNKKVIQQKRQVIFVDNCPAHPHCLDQTLSNVKIVFLPKNSTSVLQPMDQGIIRSFKCKYRTQLISHIINEVKDKKADDMKVDVLMVMNWCRCAWDGVTQETIKNCYRKAYFVKTTSQDDDDDISMETDFFMETGIENDVQDLSGLLTRLEVNVSAEDFVSVNDQLIT